MEMNILDRSKCGTLVSDVRGPDNMISDISGDRCCTRLSDGWAICSNFYPEISDMRSFGKCSELQNNPNQKNMLTIKSINKTGWELFLAVPSEQADSCMFACSPVQQPKHSLKTSTLGWLEPPCKCMCVFFSSNQITTLTNILIVLFCLL